MGEIQKYGICTFCNVQHHGVCDAEKEAKRKEEEENVTDS